MSIFEHYWKKPDPAEDEATSNFRATEVGYESARRMFEGSSRQVLDATRGGRLSVFDNSSLMGRVLRRIKFSSRE